MAVPDHSSLPVPSRQTESAPPRFDDYRPRRTTAEGGATMLLSGVFAGGAVLALLLAVYSKVGDSRAFGQISNLLLLAVVFILLGIFVLAWEITLRLIARSDD